MNEKVNKHPMQPVQWDGHGVIRFKHNDIVKYLLAFAEKHGCDLNDLAMMPFTEDDWTQMAQLMGYSVSGAGDLSYFDRKILDKADALADKLAEEIF